MALKQSRSARSKISRAKSSPSIGLTSPAMTMCVPSQQNDLLPMELPLTLSAAGSHARTSALQEKAQALPENAVASFTKSPVLLANFDHDTSSWRTSERCFIEGWMPFSEPWPRSGMMRNGIAYQLPTLVLGNFGTEFGLWPTPNATPFKGGRTLPRRGIKNPERNNWQDWCSLVLGQRYPVPEIAEQVMGFPMGYTAIKPLETP